MTSELLNTELSSEILLILQTDHVAARCRGANAMFGVGANAGVGIIYPHSGALPVYSPADLCLPVSPPPS